MWKNRWFQTSPKKANSLYVSRLNSGQRGRQTECVHALGYCYTLLLILVLWVPETCLCRRTFYRPTNWGRVGWGGMWYHSSVLQDMMRCNATHGVGWGVVWYHSSVLQDMMRCYARMGWGGVGCDIIRQYCKTWCDATLRMGWGWVWYYSSVLQDMMWCYSTHGVGWGGLWYHSSLLQDMMCCYATHGVGWGVISFVSTARHDAMLRYARGGVGCDIIRSQVQGKRNGLLFKYIRSQQWRWEHTGFDFLTATGEAVRSLMRWREKATLFVHRVLQHKTL